MPSGMFHNEQLLPDQRIARDRVQVVVVGLAERPQDDEFPFQLRLRIERHRRVPQRGTVTNASPSFAASALIAATSVA